MHQDLARREEAGTDEIPVGALCRVGTEQQQELKAHEQRRRALLAIFLRILLARSVLAEERNSLQALRV